MVSLPGLCFWYRPQCNAKRAPCCSTRDTWSLFTMLAHFGAPQHVTLEELSVELFYPADAATRDRLMTLNTALVNPVPS